MIYHCKFREVDGLPATHLLSLQARSATYPEGSLIGLLLRASNEGLPRPRVARAKETNGLPSSPYATLEKYEWDMSYTLVCRLLLRQRGLPSRIKPGSGQEQAHGSASSEQAPPANHPIDTSHVKKEKTTSD